MIVPLPPNSEVPPTTAAVMASNSSESPALPATAPLIRAVYTGAR